jgi:hypothetical protein
LRADAKTGSDVAPGRDLPRALVFRLYKNRNLKENLIQASQKSLFVGIEPVIIVEFRKDDRSFTLDHLPDTLKDFLVGRGLGQERGQPERYEE